MEEVWKTCPEFSQYEISNLGRVRLCKIVRPRIRRGYPSASFGKNGKQWDRSVHRMAWEAFHGSIPPGMVINHINGEKTDNRIENLECCTPSQNSIHSYYVLGKKGSPPPRYERSSDHPRAKITAEGHAEVLKLRSAGMSQQAIADKFGVSQTAISSLLRKKTWKVV